MLARAHLGQVLVAALSFALPLLLGPWVRSAQDPLLWHPITVFPGDGIVRHLLVGDDEHVPLYAVSASGGLYARLAPDREWVRRVEGLPRSTLDGVRILDVARDPRETQVFYAIVESRSDVPRPMLYWTADAGQSWRPRASLGRERLRTLAFDPAGNDLYVVTSNDILRAVEPDAERALAAQERFQRGLDGLQWTSVYPLDVRIQTTLLAVGRQAVDSATLATQTPPMLYLGTRGRGLHIVALAASPDEHLMPVSQDADTLFLRTQATIHALCVLPRHPEQIYAGTERGLYTTRDGGRTWYATAYALRTERVLALAADPTDDERLYAGLEGGGVVYSQDAGATWQPLGRGLGRATVYALTFERGSAGALYAGTDRGLWRLLLPAGTERNAT